MNDNSTSSTQCRPSKGKKVFIRSGIRYDYLMETAAERTRRRFLEHMVSTISAAS
jgi:hypothetical protein